MPGGLQVVFLIAYVLWILIQPVHGFGMSSCAECRRYWIDTASILVFCEMLYKFISMLKDWVCFQFGDKIHFCSRGIHVALISRAYTSYIFSKFLCLNFYQTKRCQAVSQHATKIPQTISRVMCSLLSAFYTNSSLLGQICTFRGILTHYNNS